MKSKSNKAVKARAKEPIGGQVNHASDNGKPLTGNGPLTFISMFSGIEAASVAFKPLGWHALAFAEIDKFPSAVLAHHYPNVPNVGDMAKHDWSQYAGMADIVCGGPPCQAFSVAGLRAGMDDPRGQLSIVYMRALHAIKPRNAIIENVPGWLSSTDNAFGCFLAGLVGADDALPPPTCGNGKPARKWPNAGMVAGPKGRAAWRILDAQYFGLAQRRKRVIVVADFGNGADPAAVLFERAGMQGNSAPRRETGKDVAAEITHALKAEGADASEDGTGRGNPIVFGWQNSSSQGLSDSEHISPTLDKSKTPAVAVSLRGREGGGTAELGDEIANALRASGGGGDKAHVLTFAQDHAAGIKQSEISGTLTKEGPSGSASGNGAEVLMLSSAVRRLTPVECERLQGFPDNYTNIPYRGKLTSPDGPRYKALGNSWAVPKFTWIGERIARFMPANNNEATEMDAA